MDELKKLAKEDIKEFARVYALNLLIKEWFKEKNEEVLDEIKKIIKENR